MNVRGNGTRVSSLQYNKNYKAFYNIICLTTYIYIYISSLTTYIYRDLFYRAFNSPQKYTLHIL